MNDTNSRAPESTAMARHQAFVQMQNTCPLCNTSLTIKVLNYDGDMRLREEATCPKCRLLARVKDHDWH